MKFLIPIVLVGLLSCSPKFVDMFPVEDSVYQQEILDWQISRNRDIKSPKGWLSVIGLYWLQEGRNSIGSDPTSDIVFPEMAANKVGDLYLENGELYFKSFGESYVSKNDKGFREGTMFSDARRVPTELSYKSLYFYVIRRGTKFGLRLKNTLAKERFAFKGIDNFEINKQYRYTAKVNKSGQKDSILINDISGIETMYRIENILSFKESGETYELIAFDGGKDKYFIIFSDETNGKDTYSGGRFIYVDKPKPGSNQVLIDFNKAHNPPCAFTNFATCPIPPPENHVAFKIKAGEKRVPH
jgi:uncharacterized protein (DUF1684 family)